jgi:beta-glucosidase
MGRMAGKVVDGASKKGVYCYFKHFCVNDQEKNREGTMTFVDEQALRQIYLRSFQMVIQEGHSRGIMSSYNRLGMIETAANYNLLTNVLRKEWGFQGAVMSDMDHKNNGSFNGTKYENINWRCLSGNNAQLDNNTYGDKIECKWDDDEMMAYFTYNGEKHWSYSWYYAVRVCAKEILFAAANCAKVKNNVLGQEVHGVMKASTNKININEAAEITFDLADDAKFGKGDAEQAVTAIADIAVDLEQVNHQLPAGMTAEDGKISGTPTKRGVYPVLVWAKITLADGTEKEVGEVFDIEVYDPAYEAAEETPAPAPEAGLPLAAIIGISVGGGVLVLAGGFALVWFLVIKKGKKEAKAE